MKKDDMIKIVLENVQLNLVQKRLLAIGTPVDITMQELGVCLKSITNVELQRILDLIDFEKRW